MSKKEETPSFEITPETMAILPCDGGKGGLRTRIMEKNADYYVEELPGKVIDEACKFFGASLKGRQAGTFSVASLTHKVPIAIDPYSGMYYFPTESPLSSSCIWIAHTHVKSIKSTGHEGTEVFFTNGKSLVVDISYGSMQNQINRTAQFRYLLNNRLNGQ